MRLLSPCGSQILLKQLVGADHTSAGDATQLEWELDEDRVRCVVSFSFRSVEEPSWGDRGSFCIRGCLSLFGSIVGP